MDSGSGGDGHAECFLHSFDCFHCHGVSHGHSRTEVGVGDAFRCESLHECADDAVGTRIPSGGDDADCSVFFCHFVK